MKFVLGLWIVFFINFCNILLKVVTLFIFCSIRTNKETKYINAYYVKIDIVY
jgi:hypothetical protein